MAQKRMFDRAILDTDRFMDLSMSSKALYFLLGMEADDEGFVSPKKVMRIHGGNDDDIKILIAKNFVIPFNSGVVVITDWRKNNWLDARRIRPTEYVREKEQLALTDNNKYVLSNGLASARLEEYRGEESSIEENSIDESSSEHSSQESLIPQIIKAFETVNPACKKMYGNKTQRSACSDLIENYGLEEVLKVIEILPETNGMEYVPVVTTPLQLRDKWVQLGTALKRVKIKKQPEIIIINNKYGKN